MNNNLLVDKKQYNRKLILRRFLNFFRAREWGIFLALILIFSFFSVAATDFLTLKNIINIMQQISQYTIMACGMTMIIIAAEIDLSVGTFFGLSAAVLAKLIKLGLNNWASLLVILIIGAIVGFINGTLTTKIKIPSFIVTLGMYNIFKTFTLIITKSWVISGFEENTFFFKVFSGHIGIFPTEIIIMIFVLLISYLILNRSIFGYNLFATGGNKVAAKLSGVNTDKIKINAFVISTVLVALTGTIGFSHVVSASPESGAGRELDVIAAVIVGGTSLYGGTGTILGTFLGAAIIGILRNGLIMLGVKSYWHALFIGGIIIVAVAFNSLIARNKQQV
ncbi:MAG: ABC transporter permease [Actinobacteria bacterium]|nr:ABC transporter permease [Actinomycetota bacterium]